MRNTLRIAAAAVALAGAATVARAQDFKVIVHPSNGVAAMSADEITKIFLKQETKFPTGAKAEPVDQKGAARGRFSRAVLGRASSAVDTYWQQQIFSGREVPPASKGSDEEVITFVRTNPAAIGYVSAAADVSGVKTVTVR